ncbi:MAG: DUF4159 domain-containing protein [Candidatus Poribacteria bacterium]|nr:DUF4159 domain-containing protein [Candidatus Poribacteria bacterium]
MTSVIIHGGIVIIIGVLLIIQTHQFKDLVGVEMYPAKPPPKPQVRKPVIKPVVKPMVSTTNTIPVEPVNIQFRAMTRGIVHSPSVQAQTVDEFSNQVVKLNAPINPNVPKVIDPNAPVPQLVTHAVVHLSDSPDALAFSPPVATGTGGSGLSMGYGVSRRGGIGRGAGGGVQVKLVEGLGVPGLSMINQVGAVGDALSTVVEGMMLGNLEVRPLPRGEPGGRVVGQGSDIRGVFRFTRVRHRLSDWWADASALNALAKWLNEKTKIKTDMSVEGGALQLNDANLMKSPLLFMTGHDPRSAYVKSFLGSRSMGADGKLDMQLSQSEAAGLRRYLVQKGGFLVFDDCGVNSPTQSMTRLFLTQMRFILPEYHVQRVPNDHDIYKNFYQLGGPPVGFSIYWWGVNPPKRNYLEGIAIGDNLCILVIRRDYMCAMEAVSLPSRRTHYSPGVYRFLTNVVVYALTHGNIADYSGYVPADGLEKYNAPTRAPQAATIGAVESRKGR